MNWIEVSLDNPLGRGEVHYTLDGDNTGMHWQKYTEPFRLATSSVVKAQIFLDNGRRGDVAELLFVRQRPREPVAVTDLVPGLEYEYYEGGWKRLPGFDKLVPTAVGTAAAVDLTIRKRDDHFGVRFTGYIEVPANGVYTFYLTSDDGSKLWIGSDLVIDHDGLHGLSERRGQIILQAGKHPMTVVSFQAGGLWHLGISYEGPGIARQPIPTSVYWRPRKAD